MKIDPASLAIGYRTSKMVGSSVVLAGATKESLKSLAEFKYSN